MRGLPSGYTELEYIESSGSQYINTDFMPDNNTRVIVDAEAVGSASSSHFLFGCRTSGTSESFCFFYYNNWCADFQTSANRKTFSDITFTDRLFVDFNGNVLTVNDTLVSFTETTFQTIVPLQLFAVNTNGTIGSMLAAKMYSCRIYDNGILARDFVPATDGSGTAGMYDLVTSVFYTNAGSGAFIEGPEATVNDSAFTKLEYIQATGTQYINTRVTATANTTAKYKYSIDTILTYGPHVLSGSSWYFPMLRGNTSAGTFVVNRGGNEVDSSAISPTVGLIYEIDASFVDDYVTVNGESYGPYAMGDVSTDTQTLHLMTYGGSPGNSMFTMSGKLYYCQIYENGTMVRDYIPVKHASGTVGLYDLVTATFYTNGGSGTFTAGPEITFGQGIAKLNAAPFILNAGKARLASGICEITEGITLISGVLKKFVFKSAGPDVEGMAITCTGAYTDQIVTMSGMAYRLLTFTSSGTLKVPEAIKADVWMVGGGAGGKHGGGGTGFGGCGGYSLFAEGIILNANESVAIVVGSGGAGGTRKKDEDGYWEYTTGTGGKSSFGEYSTGSANNTSGGSGGGSAKNSTTILTGDGLSKYPFEDSGYFTDPLSGGGGGGAHHSGGSGYSYAGGAGGANGGNGNLATQSSWNSDSTQSGGSGGNKGGGTGAQATSVSAGSASAATYYGGGGGGGAYCQKKTSSNVSSAGAAGYQGIVYVRIPLEQ